MKKVISIFLILFGLLFSNNVFAFDIEGSVEVPKNCEVIDTSGKLHSFPKENSPEGFLGVCAIVAAKRAGIINEFSFIDFGFGLFLDSINSVKTNPDWDLSWFIYNPYPQLTPVGLADLVLKQGDKLSFVYTSFSTGQEFDQLLLNISLVGSGSSSSGSQGGIGPAVHYFSAENAIRFLAKNQAQDGSFGNQMFTDWTALAFSAFDPQHPGVLALKNYLINNPDPGLSLGSQVLSYIRRAMALMALGINPYSGTKVNYIQKIIESFDGRQIGDPALLNDDIFALIVLRKAGFDLTDEIVAATTKFILENQKSDGSFEGGVDMTAAAIQSLSLVSDIEDVPQALNKAKTYLQSQQKEDGGFGNPDSTTWAMQAIAALGEDWHNWKKKENNPGTSLFSFQRIDGSLLSPTPIWSTAYAVAAVLGKSWGMILNNFPKQEVESSLALAKGGANSELGLEEVKSSLSLKERQKELERISKELALIQEKALALQEKISLLALKEAENLAQHKEEPKEQVLAQKQETPPEEKKPILPAIKKTKELPPGALSAQVGVFAREFLPYIVAGIITIVSLFLIIPQIKKLP